MSKTLWYPHNSLAKESEDIGNVSDLKSVNKRARRKTARIERRKEATVDVRAATALGNVSPALEGYSTVETRSYNGLDKFVNWKDTDPNSDVCGWKDDENIAKALLFRGCGGNTSSTECRSSLQSREISDRLYSSRLNSQMSRRRERYRFTHCNMSEEHIKCYNESCSYSFLTFCTRRSSRTVFEREDIEEEKIISRQEDKKSLPRPATVSEAIFKPGKSESSVPSIPLVTTTTVTNGNRVLHALADRLGVKESIDEPKLLQSPVRPTPPSITKKRSDTKENLALCAENKRNELGISSTESISQSSSKQSKRRRTPHQLPAIHRKEKKSTSSISLSKYFHVNTKTSKSIETNDVFETEDEGEDATVACSNSSSLLSILSSKSGCDDNEPSQNDQWPKFITVDNSTVTQKEEVIRRKADSLGLLSHKWAKNFIERGFMNGSLPHKLFYDCSRPATSGTVKPSMHKSSPRRKEKMEELKGIYGSKKNKNNMRSRTPLVSARKKDTRTNTPHPAGSDSAVLAKKDREQSSKMRHQVSRPPTRSRSFSEHKPKWVGSNNGYMYGDHTIHQRHTSETRHSNLYNGMIHIPVNKEFQLKGLTHRITTRM